MHVDTFEHLSSNCIHTSCFHDACETLLAHIPNCHARLLWMSTYINVLSRDMFVSSKMWDLKLSQQCWWRYSYVLSRYIVFTWMQDDSKQRRPLKNKTSSKIKTFCYYLHTCNTQSMSDSVRLYHSESLSTSSQPVPSLSSHSLLTFHHIPSSVPSTALDIYSTS